MDKSFTISEKEFQLIRDLVCDKFGITLPPSKKELTGIRLSPILFKRSISSFLEYYQLLIKDRTGIMLCELANTITTTYSYFYREEKNFEYFIDIVFPDIIEKLKKEESIDIRIWVAGCASGEEAYSLAMLMDNYLNNFTQSWEDTILATDISRPALEIAKRGIFLKDVVRPLPQHLRSRYLCPLEDDYFEVVDFIRDKVLFRRFNLAKRDYPFKKKFHAIFCRNVMMYFDRIRLEDLINNLCFALGSGGHLFIGFSETLDCSKFPLEYISPSVYRRI